VQRVCIFCGSSFGARESYRRAAVQLGESLAAHKIGVVYGGGNVGLMGALADAALAGGGEVIGVIPGALVAREIAHDGLSDLRVVGSMHERKALMADLSDAFIALPGGYGTLEEFCEMVTWSQLGILTKPCGLLNVGGYFDPLIAMLDRATQEGFIPAKNRALVLEETEPERMLEALQRWEAVPEERWILGEER